MIAPIAIRELLVASRRPISWRIRLAMTFGAVVICFIALANASSLSSAGRGSFNVLSILCLTYTLLAGFIFTAHCISEERRDGTFGLLYLTPLSSWDVIAGKLASSSLQGIFGLIALIPVLSLSLLAGGVTAQQLIRVVWVLAATLLLSLAAGIFASASARTNRGAASLTAFLVVAPLLGGWLGVMLAAAISYISEQEKKRRANAWWISGYVLLIAFLLWLVVVSGIGLIGSPGLTFAAAINPRTSSFSFLASVSAIFAIALFYLFSATLCTEWYRTAREIVMEKEGVDHIDDTFFPGLRSKGRVANDPAGWLLSFLQSPPLLFYISLALMLLISIGHGRAPSVGGLHFFTFFVGMLPYIAFNFSIATFCAAPFHLLERSGFFETLLTTPIGIPDLVRAQRRIFWRTLKLPLLFLVLAAMPAGFRFAFDSSMPEFSWVSVSLYLFNWIIGWLIFALQLEAISLLAMRHGMEGRKPMNAALRALAMIVIPQMLANVILPPLAWSFRFVQTGGFSFYFAFHIMIHAFILLYYLRILRSTKIRLRLRTHLLRP